MVETIDGDVDAAEDDDRCGGKAGDPGTTGRTEEEGAIVDSMSPQRAGSPTRKIPSQPPDQEAWGKGGKELGLGGAGKPHTSSVRGRECVFWKRVGNCQEFNGGEFQKAPGRVSEGRKGCMWGQIIISRAARKGATVR